MKKAVDTNVLIRILVDDKKHIDQTTKARLFAKKAGQLFVPQIVQIELVWVLETAYNIPKEEVITLLMHLYENEAFILQQEAHYNLALQLYQTCNADFSDCLIAVECYERECQVFTFDKKFAKLPKVNLISAHELATE